MDAILLRVISIHSISFYVHAQLNYYKFSRFPIDEFTRFQITYKRKYSIFRMYNDDASNPIQRKKIIRSFNCYLHNLTTTSHVGRNAYSIDLIQMRSICKKLEID